MNSRLKEIVAAGRGQMTTRQTQQRLADIIEKIEAEQGGFLLKEDYSGPAETTLLEESQRHDREQHKGMKLSVARASGRPNELTRAIFGDEKPKMYFDIGA